MVSFVFKDSSAVWRQPLYSAPLPVKKNFRAAHAASASFQLHLAAIVVLLKEYKSRCFLNKAQYY